MPYRPRPIEARATSKGFNKTRSNNGRPLRCAGPRGDPCRSSRFVCYSDGMARKATTDLRTDPALTRFSLWTAWSPPATARPFPLRLRRSEHERSNIFADRGGLALLLAATGAKLLGPARLRAVVGRLSAGRPGRPRNATTVILDRARADLAGSHGPAPLRAAHHLAHAGRDPGLAGFRPGLRGLRRQEPAGGNGAGPATRYPAVGSGARIPLLHG